VAGFFRTLGKLVGPTVRKADWMVKELTATDDRAIRAEYRVGRDMARALTGQTPGDADPQVAKMLGSLGDRLAVCVKNKAWQFSFRAVKQRQINAFALPGGFIFVTRVLLELCQWDPDEIAAILAHEMAHVVKRHAKDRIMNRSLISIVTAATRTGGVLHESFRPLVGAFLECSYSQEQELEADELGARLVRAAGFDPAGAVRLLQRLKQCAGERTEKASYFSSHPPHQTRIANLRRLLDD